MDYYIRMDWVSVPDTLVQKLIDHSEVAQDAWASPEANGHYKQFKLPVELQQWFYDNLPIPSTYEVMLQQYDGIARGTKHIDKIRDFSYNYVLLTGGDTRTSWYDEKGNMLDTIQYEPFIWYRHEGSIRHDVSQMSSKRLAVTVFDRHKKR
jgi:hypothetical protein